jgi:DUF4097 and DUF4098 domain-containing protein YvlB
MKHIKLFEDFVNEGINPYYKPINKIPARTSTVINKIIKVNPWKRGTEIANTIEKNWSDIVDSAKDKQYQRELVDILVNKDYMIEMSDKYRLDIHFMVRNLLDTFFK